MTNKLNCDSCGHPVDEKLLSTCVGSKHPEKGFCEDDLFFCPPCLNQKGYCDWCSKKLKELR